MPSDPAGSSRFRWRIGRWGWRRRVASAGVVGVLVVAGSLLAFAVSFADRILPGVRVGSVDLSGLDRAGAEERLAAAFKSFRDGGVLLGTGDGPQAITYAEVGRRPDVARMVDAAWRIGRTGDVGDRVRDAVRSVTTGVVVEPALAFDAAALRRRLDQIAALTDRPAVDAAVLRSPSGFTVRSAVMGRALDKVAVATAIERVLTDPAALTGTTIEPKYDLIEPAVDSGEAQAALAEAMRITASDLVLGLEGETWTIPRASVASWIRFGPDSAGAYAPRLDETAPHAAVSKLAPGIDREPRDSSFALAPSGLIVPGARSADGRAIDIHATSVAIARGVESAVAEGRSVLTPIGLVVTSIAPRLSSADVARIAPQMTRLSTWTTRYVPSERNGFGANITIPAKAIDGTVVLPGQVFDFWDAVGEVSRAKGYLPGGAIINGRTDPTGALGGGICSTSTTLFNAAARAGLDIISRTAHYYYIDRYPVGLDATVFISSSGSKTTLAFRNDTPDPILIRGYSTSGTVSFDIFGVPTGRSVTFSTPIVKSYKKAVDKTEQTSDIPAGTRKRVEYPADGFDSWVTRTVTDADGLQLHRDTFYSHYARVDGLTLVGVEPGEQPAQR